MNSYPGSAASQAVDQGSRSIEHVHVRSGVASYYDRLQVLYNWFWHSDGVHYGLWEPGIASFADAIQNTNAYLARHLELEEGMLVLDAGCGVGGTSRFLATAHGVACVGITVSPVQCRQATETARTEGADPTPQFFVGDFTAVGAADGTFDRAFAVESACHAPRKSAFAQEMYRALNPDGRLIVLDGFRSGREMPVSLGRHYERFCDGFEVHDLAQVDAFGNALEEAGFVDVQYEDLRPLILPTARRLSWLARLAWCLIGVPTRLDVLPRKWFEHIMACLSQRPLFESGVVTYGAYRARRGP